MAFIFIVLLFNIFQFMVLKNEFNILTSQIVNEKLNSVEDNV